MHLPLTIGGNVGVTVTVVVVVVVVVGTVVVVVLGVTTVPLHVLLSRRFLTSPRLANVRA